MATHEVTNQPPAFEANLFEIDRSLRDAVRRGGAGWVEPALQALGRQAGSVETQELARLANRHSPELKTHDRFGHRQDLVEFHPSYHALMAMAFGAGVHSAAWTHPGRDGAHVARAALSYVFGQAETGVCCPTAMTYASIPALRHAPGLAADWEPKILSDRYDRRPIPMAEKTGATIGMAMTEKQGGSDLRTTQTRAVPVGRTELGEEYSLTGHKWFCSAPMSDAFLTLAYAEAGLTCFLVPRSLPDGGRNTFLIQRLKDKLGNRSNASSEIEYDTTRAALVGEPGRGIATIMEMGHLTRLECAIGSAAITRRALVEALHHARHRTAFQRKLSEQPLMRATLADLAIESEAATALAMRAALAIDRSPRDPNEARLARVVVPVAKYWVCKRAPASVCEALECHGGNGYVEDGVMARLYREAPLNGVWEGSGNVICLDVLRAIRRDPEAWGAVTGELALARGGDGAYDRLLDELDDLLDATRADEALARRFAERLALAFQACLLLRYAPTGTAEHFCAVRLGEHAGMTFGAGRSDAHAAEAILERALPA